MSSEARFWANAAMLKAQCRLCPHRCKISPGERGKCNVRENVNGSLETLVYGLVAATSEDPVEKKPLFHCFPGSKVFSLGTVGCNLSCRHCQNASLSRGDPFRGMFNRMSPETVVKLAKASGCKGVAFTYNEPTVWWEFVVDTLQLAKAQGLYTAIVSNGYIEREPLEELRGVLDAANIDVKAFSEEFYSEVCGGRLKPVLETCKILKEMHVGLELTYLVIPDFNDDEEQIREFSMWVKEELGQSIPVHFTAFHPDFQMMDVPATPLSSIKRAYEIAEEAGLRFVYVGNVGSSPQENTVCPECGEVVIRRLVYTTEIVNLVDGRCGKCGAQIPLLGRL